MQKKKRIQYFLSYTALFILAAGLIYSVFFKNHKSFVYALFGDGHICYNSLIYYGRWLRQILMTLVNEHQLSIPLWDMSVGYGSDIPVTFNWMTIGDPLNLLSVFFSAGNTEYLYGFLNIFRMYLAGMTFAIYAFYHKNERWTVLGGSMVYAFCGFALFAVIRDPYFMSPMVYLPLLLLGVDKVFNKEKPTLLIVITALAGITNFYYFFMLSIWVFIYGVYRYFMIYGKSGCKVKNIACWLLRCIGFYLIGIAMAAIVLIPIVQQLLGSERFASETYVPVFYSMQYYWKLVLRFMSTESIDAWSHMGYAPICVAAVLLIFMRRKKDYRPYKIAFVMCVLFLMIPMVGSLMNAGSYVVNRWVWAFSMLVAYLFVKAAPVLCEMERKERIWIAVLCTCYAGVCLLFPQGRTTQMKLTVLVLAMTILVLLGMNHFKISMKTKKLLILGCVFVGVVSNGIMRYAGFGSNYASGFVESGQAWNLVHAELPSRELESLPEAQLARYDSLGTLEPMYNTAMNHNLNSTDFYFSLADGQITRHFDELELNVEMEHRYKGLDERTMLERLASVRYCIAGTDSKAYVPYGYLEIVTTNDQYTIYENTQALPLGYTYQNTFPYDEYEKLSAIQKQQVLMQAAVVKDETALAQIDEAKPVYNDEELTYELQASTGIEIFKDRIEVADREATVTLRTDAKADSETYLQLTGMIYQHGEGTDQEQTNISYFRGDSVKKQVLYSPAHPFYHGRDDYLINLGYTEKAETMEIQIQFAQPGTYYLNKLQVICQSMEAVDEQTQALAEAVLEDISIGDNEITGSLTLDETRMLCMAIPYSKGWSAYVDGEKVTPQQVNGMFLGFAVESGTHDIWLHYQTPGRTLGGIISCAGIAALAVVIIWYRKKAVISEENHS